MTDGHSTPMATPSGPPPRDGLKTVSSLSEFGSRKLNSDDDVFDYNAWDKIEWDETQEEKARRTVEAQLQGQSLDEDQIQLLEQNAPQFWDEFYAKNENRFFKDRRWLRLEFPELFEGLPPAAASPDDSNATRPRVVCEIGCGVGNTVFPFLESTRDANVMVYACDYSQEAINIVKSNPMYDTKRCKALVFDITSPDGPPPEITPGSVDVITCIFVLSAIHPSTWAQAVRNIHTMLRPGGLVLLRDYGRHDLVQLRFKPARVLSDHFYVRGDNTRVYFFTNDDIANMFCNDSSLFNVVQNGVDRRLLVNRHRKLKMYRVWVQAKLQKLDQ